MLAHFFKGKDAVNLCQVKTVKYEACAFMRTGCKKIEVVNIIQGKFNLEFLVYLISIIFVNQDNVMEFFVFF